MFRNSLIASLSLHILLGVSLIVGHLVHPSSSPSLVEIDLTKPFRIGGNPLLKPGGGTSLKIPKKIGIPKLSEIPGPPAPEVPKKEWVLPESKNQPTEKVVPQTGVPTTEKLQGNEVGPEGESIPGKGGGWGGGEGEGGGIPLTQFPRLLNRAEILKLLKKMYPVHERELGEQGVVIVDLHIDLEGHVTGVSVNRSAGSSFDSVAKVVAQKMRFSPAMVQKTPVAVKMRQSIVFQLED